ncbi:Mini-ribonuclease 3 [Lacrimispora sp.]|uniref:Mini-ribonuclease 3 n=1 Tax=Lacrimispora sp. TaxID=2719234 RepID=UPI00289EB053|nr:ribonuclease III domain-containing protein [Lacrimispora sp.]
MEENITSLAAFSDFFKDTLKLKEVDVKTYSPLALAYIGDAVYELIVRTKVMNHGSTQVNNMHKKSARLVNAGAQAEIIRRLLEDEDLTPEEVTTYKRGRNAKAVTTAKHATVADYRTATGFEALCGYLYLNGNLDRLVTLVGRGLERIGELE